MTAAVLGATLSVLVTGGSGYIGSHVVRRLAGAGARVCVLDIAEPPPLVRARSSSSRATSGSRPRAGPHGPRFDGVLHLAALKSVEESFRDPVRTSTPTSRARSASSTRWPRRRQEVRVLVHGRGLRQSRRPADRRDHAAVPDEPVRRVQASGRGPAPVDGERIRDPERRAAVLQCRGASLDAAIGEDWTDAGNLVPIVMQASLGVRDAVDGVRTDYPTPDGTALRDYIHVLDLWMRPGGADYLDGGGASITLNIGTGRAASVAEVIAEAGRVAGHTIPFRLRRAGPATLSPPTRTARWPGRSSAGARVTACPRSSRRLIDGTSRNWVRSEAAPVSRSAPPAPRAPGPAQTPSWTRPALGRASGRPHRFRDAWLDEADPSRGGRPSRGLTGTRESDGLRVGRRSLHVQEPPPGRPGAPAKRRQPVTPPLTAC